MGVFGCVRNMAVPGAQGLSSLTRRHGVKVASAVSVESCCLAVGEVVGHENIMSASRMNSAIVIFFNTIEKANEIVQRGIIIDGVLTPVLPISLPSKRVTLSNVPPFISDVVLTQALSRYGKLISSIKKIPIGRVSPLLKHVVSFRRSVYMVVNNDADLDLKLNFRVDDFDYVVFITTDKIKCFGCGKVGHLIRACPSKQVEDDNRLADAEGAANVTDQPAGETGKAGEAEAGNAAEAGKAGEAEAKSAVVESAVTRASNPDGAQSAGTSKDTLVSVEEEIESETNVETEEDKGESSDTRVLEVVMGDVREVDGRPNESVSEQTVFKVPLKRKKIDKAHEYRQQKKIDLEDVTGQIDSESDSESDSSVTLSQSEFSSRNYDVDDIKLFLRSTKNKRGVLVNEYFPDVGQFVEKAKNFMTESFFSNKEVYRLKKIVRKLNMDLNDGSEKV